MADNNSKQKPKNSIPMFKATNKEYKIAVITPAHSKILLLQFFYATAGIIGMVRWF